VCVCHFCVLFETTCRKFEQRWDEQQKKQKIKKKGKKIHLRNYFELTFALASTAVFCKRMRALFPIELLKNCLFAYWKSVPFRATPLVEL